MPNGRRALEWFTTIQEPTQLIGNVQATVNLTSGLSTTLRKACTVTRVVGWIQFASDSVAQRNVLYYGIQWLDADAVAAGAVPDPAQAGDRSDWLIRGYMQGIQSDLSDNSQESVDKIDNRSQRICRAESDQLTLIFENGTSTILNYSYFIRALIRLP